MSAVEFVDVTRDYRAGWLWGRPLRAVDSVSFKIEPGEVFGLVGPNRAGKTTLIKLLLSLCRPTSGHVLRLGRPVTDRTTLGRVGYMHENHAFARYLNAYEILCYYGALSTIDYGKLGPRVEELLGKVGLADRSRDPIWQYSKGMVQRLGLAQSLLNDPDLLVLDEPTEGLDLDGRRLLREVINDLKRRGRTVLLISHVLSEVEQLCSRIAVLAAGRLRYFGTVAALTPFESALHQIVHGGGGR